MISDLLNRQPTIQDLQAVKDLISLKGIEQIDFVQIRKIISGDDMPRAAMALVS
jgi:hypothetical protein